MLTDREESSEEESNEEEVPTEELEEDVFIVNCTDYRHTAATDINDVVERIVTFAAEQMKNSGKFSYGDKLMLNLRVRSTKKMLKDANKRCVVKAKPATQRNQSPLKSSI